MKTAVTKLEKDVALTQENNDILEKQYQGLQKLVLAHFSHIQVPNLPVADRMGLLPDCVVSGSTYC